MTKEQERILGNVETVFLTKVKDIFRDNLKSVTVYGSAITERFTDRFSDVNVLIILDHADPVAVTGLGKGATKIMTKNRITPLLLTEAEYLGSADVFPMEYLDIVDTRKVIFGDDLTKKLEITKLNLRHQIEEEIRGSINSIRRALVATKGSSRLMKRILKSWFGSQSALLRGLLRLDGVNEIPENPEATIKALSEQYGIDTTALTAAAKLRAGEKIEATVTAQGTLTCLTSLAKKIDAMEA